ncbi:MAG: transposase [Ignavibacteriales bacterium]|nr:transposase [Ignavibacteriales bacterium]
MLKKTFSADSTMDRIIKITDNELYHIYNRGNNRQRIFNDERDYLFFLSRFGEYATKYKVTIVVYCWMRNHYHFILRQEDGGKISKMMGTLATSYAKRFNLINNRNGHLFQGPYKIKHIASDDYLLLLSAYIHLNPKFGRLVKNAGDWRWSNFKQFREEGFLPQSKNTDEGDLHLRGNLLLCNIQPIIDAAGGIKKDYLSYVNEYTETKFDMAREYIEKGFLYLGSNLAKGNLLLR